MVFSIEQFQYKKALVQIKRLRKVLPQLPLGHWLFQWVDIRENQLKFLANEIDVKGLEGYAKKSSLGPSMRSFVEGVLTSRLEYRALEGEKGSLSIYRGVALHFGSASEGVKKKLQEDLDQIFKRLPILK